MASRQMPPRRLTVTASPRMEGSRALTALTDQEAALSSAALDTTIAALGGKKGILDTLSVASDVPEVEQLLRLVLDPRYDGISLRRLCHMAGITVVDLFGAYKKALIVQAHLLAYQAVTRKLQPVIEDLMTRAAPYTIPCYECGAKGEVVDDSTKPATLVVCPTCNGRKELLQLPDLDRQKVVLELAQLVTKASGITLQQNNMTVPPVDPDPAEGRGTLIELQRAIADLQRGPRSPILDAEMVSTAPDLLPIEVP